MQRPHAITGAAMLLRRDHARACGGFDEAFVIGDFEDTDLCFKLAQNALGAAVDLSVTMHHLERKSQTSSSSLWRINLTLYNAWTHQRRWAQKIAALPPLRH
jgi:GT2 family glycosyltransferase